MSNDIKSILMAGVGGQGIVLASNVLCSAAMHSGFDVKKSEIHGMAQRGGSVVSHVRYGSKVFSSVIPLSSANFVLSFEYMEFMRYLSLTNTESTLILNTRRILPPTVANGVEDYPSDTIQREKHKFEEIDEVDAGGIAADAGNVKAVSIVMLGRLAKFLDISTAAWETAIKENIPQKNITVNLKAFELALKN